MALLLEVNGIIKPASDIGHGAPLHQHAAEWPLLSMILDNA
jgi:hypothetical protein